MQGLGRQPAEIQGPWVPRPWPGMAQEVQAAGSSSLQASSSTGGRGEWGFLRGRQVRQVARSGGSSFQVSNRAVTVHPTEPCHPLPPRNHRHLGLVEL